MKIPISVLVLVHTHDLNVLLIQRADRADSWQSVTGSQEPGESLTETALRELREETGIEAANHGGVVDWQMSSVFEIYPQWRHRFVPGTTHNTEHVFSIEVPIDVRIVLHPDEHLRHIWLPWRKAAAKCFSWTNRKAILMLPERATAQPG